MLINVKLFAKKNYIEFKMIIDYLKSMELYAKIWKFIKVFETKQLNELLTIILILAKICIQNLSL